MSASAKLQDDGLFLLEVLIDKIVFVKSPCFSDKDFRTCVNIDCPAVEPLEICDDDPGACIAKSGGPFVKTFNNGKSCLFSLKEADITKAMSKFPIKVSVYKSLPCGCLPTKIVMGEATIDMTKEFIQARKKFLEDPTSVSYQALKDSFRIVGTDGVETGEIVMFLRISCFGKLIITRFQGAGAPPSLGAGGGGSSAFVDRSCNPQKTHQTDQDPCACGVARSVAAGGAGGQSGGSGFGSCPTARDPYNSMPCVDPDDPCFCSGPKPGAKQQMECRNTDQYCLHVPKGTLPRLPFCQLLTSEQKEDLIATWDQVESCHDGLLKSVVRKRTPQSSVSHATMIVKECLNIFVENIKLPVKSLDDNSIICSEYLSSTSLDNMRSKKRSVSFSDTVDCMLNSQSQCLFDDNLDCCLFGKQETTVYMTLFDDFSHQRNSSTQATASINKCLQAVCEDYYNYPNTNFKFNPNYCSTSTMLSEPQKLNRKGVDGKIHYSDVYFFGRKKEEPKSGMGCCGSKTKLQRSTNIISAPVRSEKTKPLSSCKLESQSKSGKGEKGKPSGSSCCKAPSNSAAAQTKKASGCSEGTSTAKAVSIKDPDKPRGCCPSEQEKSKGEMVATVSHIRIGPNMGKEPCPVHGKDPCQGPKCLVASSGEEQAAVRVSTVTNPRRGVFELVIRRITGAPLAKNELMLEWTPPPSRPPPCGSPCPIPCSPPGPCRPPKCKMIVCRPSPCRPKCCKKGCKKPCGPMPCRSVPCKKCCKSSCCTKPCRPCKPCPPPPKCRPCPPSPCKSPCGPPCSPPCCKFPCTLPCKSSPCLRPCPVGRKKPRRARSQPRIKSHRKRASPCYNRSKTCPVVRCRSVPGPCFGCCGPPCPPRKCCSVAPCKSPKCCKSSCSTCCG